MKTFRKCAALAAMAISLVACGGNPLTGRWTNTQSYPPPPVGDGMGILTTTVDFTADNKLSYSITGSGQCSGALRLDNYGISLNAASATSGTYTASTLGTCSGGPVNCEFGGRAVPVAMCGGGGSAAVTAMAAQYVLSADGRTLSLNGQVYTRAN
jgi:hypothetical protein